MLRSVLLCIFITTTISGCSAIAPLAKDALLGGAKQGIEARANISKGDAEGDSSVAQNANTAVSLTSGQREVFEGPVGTVVNEAGLPIHILLLLVLLAGWAIPSPEEMGHGLVRIVRALAGRPSPR
jgi:uncharacterized protein YceK